MRRRTSSTRPSRRRTCRAPSPSTRASASVTISRSGTGVERPVEADEIALGHAVRGQPGAEGARVRGLHRPEAAVAAAVIARAQRAAARVRDGAEAWRAVRDHDAHVAPPLALDAHAV